MPNTEQKEAAICMGQPAGTDKEDRKIRVGTRTSTGQLGTGAVFLLHRSRRDPMVVLVMVCLLRGVT